MNEPGAGYPTDQDTSPLFDHSQCVPATWSQRTHNHEGATGAWLFPDEVPRPAPAPVHRDT